MPQPVLVTGARSPIGKLLGSLSSLSAAALGSTAICAALERAGITGDQVDAVIMGNVVQAGVGPNPARLAAVGGGIPMTVMLPDIVLANQEENRLVDVERPRAAGVPVWVTVIRTLEEAFASLRRMFAEALGWPVPGWLEDAERAWDAPEPELTVPTAIPVWRDPWMVVGSDTFAGDIAARLGLLNVYGVHRERYPRVELDDITKRGAELIVLPVHRRRRPGAFPGRGSRWSRDPA